MEIGVIGLERRSFLPIARGGSFLRYLVVVDGDRRHAVSQTMRKVTGPDGSSLKNMLKDDDPEKMTLAGRADRRSSYPRPGVPEAEAVVDHYTAYHCEEENREVGDGNKVDLE